MKAMNYARQTVIAEALAPEKRKKIGNKTYIVRRYFTGRRDLREAISAVIRDEAARLTA